MSKFESKRTDFSTTRKKGDVTQRKDYEHRDQNTDWRLVDEDLWCGVQVEDPNVEPRTGEGLLD